MSSVYAPLPRNGKTAREAAEDSGTSIRIAQRWTSEPREVYLARAAERRQEIIGLRAAVSRSEMRFSASAMAALVSAN